MASSSVGCGNKESLRPRRHPFTFGNGGMSRDYELATSERLVVFLSEPEIFSLIRWYAAFFYRSRRVIWVNRQNKVGLGRRLKAKRRNDSLYRLPARGSLAIQLKVKHELRTDLLKRVTKLV